MAAAFGSISNTTYAGGRTTTTVTAPTGIVDGDILLAFIITAAATEAPDPTGPAGFSIAPGTWPMEGTDSGGFNLESRLYVKVASGESGNYSWTHSSCSSLGVVMRVTGADTSTPLSPTPTTNVHTFDGSGVADSTALGLTALANSLLIWFGWDFADTVNNLTPPSGMTERLDAVVVYVATQDITSAGATGNKTMVNNTIDINPWGASLVGVQPPAGGGGSPTVKPLAALGVG